MSRTPTRSGSPIRCLTARAIGSGTGTVLVKRLREVIRFGCSRIASKLRHMEDHMTGASRTTVHGIQTEFNGSAWGQRMREYLLDAEYVTVEQQVDLVIFIPYQ